MMSDKTIEVKPIITPDDMEYDRSVISSNPDLTVNSDYELTTTNPDLGDTKPIFSDVYKTDPIHMKLMNVNEFRYDLLTLVWDKTDYIITRDVINQYVILHVTPLRYISYEDKPIKIADVIYPLNFKLIISTESPFLVTPIEDVNMVIVTASIPLDHNTTYDITLNFEYKYESRFQYLEQQVGYLPWHNIVNELPPASEIYRGQSKILTTGETDAIYCCLLRDGQYVWMLMGGDGSLATSELGLATLGVCILGDGIYVL